MNFANTYRPKAFNDVIGQENVITILKNQVKTGEYKNCYLLVGSAGTGKTTTARIFGNIINGNKGKIIELDAASHSGVDSIREISEQCKFKPIDSKYKVYIIDEVHMLSTSAWNGFLKTLEEPPAHCIFILCTTEVKKIPVTILSRCQRFDFKRVSVEKIVGRLKYIIEEENATTICEVDEHCCGSAPEDVGVELIKATDEALQYIARISNGGVRSAISLLDTCVSYGDVDMENIQKVLGLAGSEVMVELLGAISLNDRSTIIKSIETVYNNGKDLKTFIPELLEFIVDILKYQITKDITLTKLTEKDIKRIDKINMDLTSLFDELNKFYFSVKYEANIKPLLEGVILNYVHRTIQTTSSN